MGRGRKSRRYRNQADVETQPQTDMPTVYPTAIYVRLSVENLGRVENIDFLIKESKMQKLISLHQKFNQNVTEPRRTLKAIFSIIWEIL